MFGRELSRRSPRVPVGLLGVHVNKTDIWPWAPYEAVTSQCAREAFYNHTKARGYWGGMVYPLLNMTAAGAIFYEGQLDAERSTNMSQYRCLLNQTVSMWAGLQGLDKETNWSENHFCQSELSVFSWWWWGSATTTSTLPGPIRPGPD